MDELFKKYLKGEIDYATYLQLSSSNTPKPSGKTSLADISRLSQTEQKYGITPASDLSKELNMSDEELSTYTDRGITPLSGTDYEDTRAELQPWYDQLGNGLGKFAGKTLTATAGGLAMVPGIFYGVATGSFKNIYDNAFQRALDEANKSMDEALPNYVTREEQEYGVLRSMGTMNFWANDVLGGASFVTGAILTEILSAGLMTPLVGVNAATKSMKALSAADKLQDVAGLASNVAKNLNKAKLATATRQIVTGAGYEAGVEARHFADEAKQEFINKFIEENNREPSDVELAAAMDDIYGVANGVFATNLALVGATNMVTLPKYFGPGISKRINKLFGDDLVDPNAKWVVKPSELSEKQLSRYAKNKGMSIDEVKKLPALNKFDTFSRLEKAGLYSYDVLKKPLTEGLFEEGMQSFVNKTALDYVDNKLSDDNIESTTDIVESMSRAFAETYGGNDKDFWKEVLIGGILGTASGVKLGGKGKIGYDITNYSKDKNINDLITKASQSEITKNIIASSVRQANINAKQTAAQETGDMFEAKLQEDQSMHDFVTTKIKLGRFDEIEDEIADKVNKMSPEEFGSEYGYENLSKEELLKRKSEVVREFTKNAKDIKDAYELASKSNHTNDADITDALSFVFYQGKRIDAREEGVTKTISEKLGKIYDVNTLKKLAQYVDFEKSVNSEIINQYKERVKQLEKLNREELEGNNNKTSKDIMSRGKEIEATEQAIFKLQERLQKEYEKYLETNKILNEKGEYMQFGRDSVQFKNDFALFEQIQRDSENIVGASFYKRPDIEKELSDLRALSRFREQQITTANYFFTKEGQNTLQSQINRLKKLNEEERVTAELNLQNALALQAKRDYTTMRELAALSYKTKAVANGTDPAAANPEVSLETLKSALKDIKDPAVLNQVQTYINKIIEKLNSGDISDLNDYLNNIYNEISDLNLLSDVNKKLVQDVFNEIKSYFGQPSSQSVISNPNRMFKLAMTPEGEKFAGENFLNVDGFTIEVKEADKDYVEKELQRDRLAFLEDSNGKPINPELMRLRTLQEYSGKYYQIQVYHSGVLIGRILDPRRYLFKNEKGVFVPFDGSVYQLRLLNPAYVNSDGEVTELGKTFMEYYEEGVKNFDAVFAETVAKEKKTIKGGENSKVLELFTIIFDKSFRETKNFSEGHIMKVLKETPELYNVVPLKNENGIEVEPGVFKKVPIIQSNYGGILNYFYYDKETESLKPVTSEEGVETLRTILQVNNKNSAFSYSTSRPLILAVPRPEGKFGFIALDIPKMDMSTNTFYNNVKEFVDKFKGKPVLNPSKSQNETQLRNEQRLHLNFRVDSSDGKSIKILLNAGLKGEDKKDSPVNVKASIYYDGNYYNLDNAILWENDFNDIKTSEGLLKHIQKKINYAKSFNSVLKDVDIKITGVDDFTSEKFNNLEEVISTLKAYTRAKSAIVFYPKNYDASKPTSEKPPKKESPKKETPKEDEIDFDDLPTAEEMEGAVEYNPDNEATPNDFGMSTPSEAAVDPNIFDLGDEFAKGDEEIPPFKISEEPIVDESFETREKNVAGILPDWIPVKELNQLRDNLKANGNVYGVFYNSVVYLASKAPKGVEYHEAFHVVFRMLLNDIQIAKAYSEARVKYGQPTAEQLEALKNTSALLQNLDKETLTKLWYEEQMADDFQKFMLTPKKPKSFLDKIFDILKRLIFWSRDNRTYLDKLFNDIQKGKFRTAPKAKNKILRRTPAFKAITFTEKYGNETRTRSLSPSVSNSLYNIALKQIFDLAKTSTITPVKIREVLSYLKDDFLTDANLQPLYDQAAAKGESIGRINYAKLTAAQMRNALSKEENIKTLVDEIKAKYDSIVIYDYTLEQGEDQDTVDLPTSLIQADNATIGGLNSTSKEMRKYLQMIPSGTDFLGLGLNLDFDSQYVSYVDAYEVYNGLARVLANRKPSELLKALYLQSKQNPELKAFVNVLVGDIARELGYTNMTVKEISNLPLLELDNSTIFRMFVANFRKVKMDFISITPDVENNRFKLFRSNINDIKDVEVSRWANTAKVKNIDSSKQNTVLGRILRTFKTTNVTDLESFNNNILKIKKDFQELGIELSNRYLELSYFEVLPNKEDLFAKDDTGYFEELKENIIVYENVKFITTKDIEGLVNSTQKGDMYTKLAGDESSGALSKLKDIAEANSYFDFTIIPTTFKNIEGKTIYSYIQPNYIADLINAFKDNSQNIIDSLKLPFEEGFEIFKTFLDENNLRTTDYLEKRYFNSIRNNPMLLGENASEFLENLSPFIMDGSRVVELDDAFKELSYKSTDEGSSFQSLSPRGKILSYFYLFATNQSKGALNSIAKLKGKFVPYIPFQNEGKNTQYAVMMPKDNYVVQDGSKLTNLAYERLTSIVNSEISYIQTYLEDNDGSLRKVNIKNQTANKVLEAYKNNDIQTIIDIYNDPNEETGYPSLPRGLKFSTLSAINKDGNLDEIIKSIFSNEPLTQEFINKTIDTYINDVLNETLELLSSPEIRLIAKEGDVYKNILLPSEFNFDTDGTKVNLNKIKNFLINDLINSHSLMNMLVGNINDHFKDAIDLPKRMAGLNAAGPSLGNTQSKVVIIKSIEEDFTDISGKNKGKKDRADGQSYATQLWYEDKYLKTFKKWNKEIEAIYKKIRSCKKLSWAEKELLEDYGALNNSRKISMFNYALYGKTSVNTISRNEVSVLKKMSRAEYKVFESLIDSLYSTNNPVEKKAIQKELVKYYEPIPHAKEMHELLNKMESADIDLALEDSAVKTIQYNVQDRNSDLQGFDIGDTFVREQVITDNMKTQVIDGTQLLQLIDSEQKSGTVVNVNGKDVTIDEVVNTFKNMKAYRIKEAYDKLKKSYLENNKPKYRAILKTFKESISAMGNDPILEQILTSAEDLDAPKFNLNMTRSIFTVEKMLYAYLSKALSHKVAGQKFTLLTDRAYKVQLDENDNIVTIDDWKKGASVVKSRDLQVKYDSVKKCFYAECVISPQTAYRYGLRPGDEVAINSGLLEYIGTRIPTQEKSSMAYLKVIDYLLAEKGNTIILPFETMIFSGADFDIDSLFAQSKETYINEEGDEVLFGDYVKTSTLEDAYEQAYKEYLDEASKDKSVKVDYDRYLKEEPKYDVKLEEREYIESLIALTKVKKIDDFLELLNTQFPEAKEAVKDFYEKTKNLPATVSYFVNNFKVKDFTKEQYETLKQIQQSLKEIKQKALKAALKRNNYITDLQEFISKKGGQIRTNKEAYEQGKLSQYKPLTIPETNNFMFELKSVLIRNGSPNNINSGNQLSSLRDVEREAAADLTKKMKELNIKDPTVINHYLTIASKAKMSIANAVGATNIGVGALGNILGQYLMRYKSTFGPVFNYPIANTFSWSNGQSVNEILSMWISLGVDNAKHQDAGRFNIDTTVQGAFVMDAIINKDTPGYNAENILLLGRIPIIEEFLNEIKFSQEQFKTKKETDYELTKVFIRRKFGEKIKEYIESYGSLANWENFTSQEILNYLSSVGKEDFKTNDELELSALRKMLNLTILGDFAINFTNLLSVIKGNKTSTAENLRLLDSLDKLGIAIEGDNFVHTLEYESDPEAFPIDFLDIFNNDPFLKQEILIFNQLIKNDVGKFLIPGNADILNLFDRIKNNMKTSFDRESSLNKMINLVNNSLAFYVMKKSFVDAGRKLPDVYQYLSLTEEPTDYIQSFNRLQASPLLKDNKFLHNLMHNVVEGRDGSPLNGRFVHSIQLNSRLSLTPNMKKRVADDMYALYAGEVFNEDGSKNEELSRDAQFFIGYLVNQIYIKDAGLFVNQNILPFTEPLFLNNYSLALDKVQQALAGESTFEEVFGKSKNEVFEDVFENFMRDYNNNIHVRGSKLEYILANLKRSFKSFLLLNQNELASDPNLNDILETLSKISDNEATEEDYNKISPFKFNEDRTGFKLNIFPEFKQGAWKDYNPQEDVSEDSERNTIKSIYKKALASTGIIDVELFKKDGKIYKNFNFFEYLVINQSVYDPATNKKQNKRILYKLVDKKVSKKGTPISAEYKEVPFFGSKAFLHYYFTPEQNNILFPRVSKPEVKEVKKETKVEKRVVENKAQVGGPKGNLDDVKKAIENSQIQPFYQFRNFPVFAEDYKNNFSKFIEKVLNLLKKDARLDSLKESLEELDFGDGLAPEVKKLLTFVEAAENNTLEEVIKRCKQ